MAGYYAPSYLGSTTDNRSVSRLSGEQSVRNHLQELEDDNVQEDEIEDPPLSPHRGETTPLRDQLSLPPIRRPLCPPGPESLFSSRHPEDTSSLMHANPFVTIQNPKKHKVYSEVFTAFTGQPRGKDPNHIILGDAGLAMAKRVLHPPEMAFRGSQCLHDKVSDSSPRPEDELGKCPLLGLFLVGHKQNPSYKLVYDFKTKMFGSLKAQRTSLVPLFMRLDRQWR